MARAMHEPLLFYHSIVFSGCIQLSLYMYANSCSIEAFLLHLAYLSSEFKVGATYISTVQLALFPGISGSFTGLPVVSSSVISISGEAAFLYAFSSNNRTIPAPLPELQIIFFHMCLLFQYPYTIYYCIYLCVNKVENPGSACWESLPKWRKSAKYGRDSRGCLLEISTQMAQISERVEISGAAS